MYDAKALGRAIRRHRDAAGLTQQELAARSGISDKKISRMEAGFMQDPGFGDVIPVAAALGLSPNAIAEVSGLWAPALRASMQDPREEWLEGFLGRATKEMKDSWLQMAYGAALGLEHQAAAPKLPTREPDKVSVRAS